MDTEERETFLPKTHATDCLRAFALTAGDSADGAGRPAAAVLPRGTPRALWALGDNAAGHPTTTDVSIRDSQTCMPQGLVLPLSLPRPWRATATAMMATPDCDVRSCVCCTFSMTINCTPCTLLTKFRILQVQNFVEISNYDVFV